MSHPLASETRLEHAVIVSDAHVGHTPGGGRDRAFLDFLHRVPDLATHLVLNGDVFDFWFEYHAVVPRAAFPTLAALAAVRRAGVRLTITGGNHDRWGMRFWSDELGAEFLRDGGDVTLAGLRAHVHHGDGLCEAHRAARVMHAITRHPLTAAAFRLVHPDIGFWFVRRMSRVLGESTREPSVTARSAAAQREYATRFCAARPDLQLVAFAHTHVGAIEQFPSGQWYVNSGAWMLDQSYVVVTPERPELRRFRTP